MDSARKTLSYFDTLIQKSIYNNATAMGERKIKCEF